MQYPNWIFNLPDNKPDFASDTTHEIATHTVKAVDEHAHKDTISYFGVYMSAF